MLLQYVKYDKKSGSEIGELIDAVLCDHGRDFGDCRRKGYENGANMSGKIKGIQAQILKKNKLATYSPCPSHTFNLVGVHAAQSSPEVSTFYGCINGLYTFLSGKEQTGCSLHCLSDTR